MSKKIKYLYLFVLTLLCSLFLVMCGKADKRLIDNNTASNEIVLKEVNYGTSDTIYDMDYQKTLQKNVKSYKNEKSYTLNNPLIIVNPFRTNTTGLYVYFKSDGASYLKYSVHVSEARINDFERILYNGGKDNLTKEHEYTLVGLVAGMENNIKFELYDKNSRLISEKYFSVMIPEMNENSDLIIKKEMGSSNEDLSEGLFATLGHLKGKHHNSYYYDNDGVARSEITLDGYRIDNMIFKDNLMYISVNTSKIAALDRLGAVVSVYDLGNYEMHHDFIEGNNEDLLILVDDLNSDTEEDKVISLNLKNKKIKEIIDMGDLLPEGLEKLDWIHLNSLYLSNDNELLLSARELSTIINVKDIYKKPELNYMIGDKKFWEDTPYIDYVFEREGEFIINSGQHSLEVIKDDSLNDSQYYLDFYNNNTGESKTNPNYEWINAEDVDADSMYYKYLVDENNRTFTLVQEIIVPGSRYISSVQDYKDHIIIDSGQSYVFMEYTKDGDLIAKYTLDEEIWGLYRCFKYDFNKFYFYEL
ncbi:MAG: aryl-sulfate sulfotransferase [Clostridium sp.]|nr:aryl-sulfate sulfotransferase [Clostridium sp.]